MNIRYLLATVVLFPAMVAAQEKTPDSPKKAEEPKEVDKDTIEAWKKRGFSTGWVCEAFPSELRVFGSGKKVNPAVPGFFRRDKVGVDVKLDFKDLPAVEVPFALELRGSTGITETVLKDIGTMKSLVYLDLTATRVSDATVAHLSPLPNLRHLELTATRVSDVGLKEVAKHKNLTALILSGRTITDAGVKELAGLEHLTTLCLWDTAVTDEAMKDFVAFKKLTLLRVNGRALTEKSLRVLREADKLHILFQAQGEKGQRPTKAEEIDTLALQGGIGDEGLKELAGLKNLRVLKFERNGYVTGSGFEHLRELKSLTTLHLRECGKLTDENIKQIAALPALTTLTLDQVPITAAGLKHLGGCPTLMALDLSNTLQKLTTAQRNEVLRELQKNLPKCKIKG